MNRMILFSKHWPQNSAHELCHLARYLSVDGFDLCVRAGYTVNPDNVADALVPFVATLRTENLHVPLVTAEGSLVQPADPTARPILQAMDRADIRLLKLGYFRVDPIRDYRIQFDQVRRAMEGWQQLGREYRVKICYHTHAHRRMGLNAGLLAQMINGLDPEYIGAYLDPLHLTIEGEEFELAAAIVKPYLSVIALKDVLIHRSVVADHGRKDWAVVPAGQGMVDWTAVFSTIRNFNYSGPLSIHGEFVVPPDQFMSELQREVAYYRSKLNAPTPGI